MKKHRVEECLFSEGQIAERIEKLAREILSACGPGPLVMVGILRGSFIFLADLVRALHRHGGKARIDFMVLESYGSGTESSGRVKLDKDVTLDVKGADVLLVDDILDSGRTLSYAKQLMRDRGAKSVRACVLLDKPARRVVPGVAEFVGFTVPDEFVVGYGLDFDHAYREIPWIGKVSFD